MIWRKRCFLMNRVYFTPCYLCTSNQVKGLERRKTLADNDNVQSQKHNKTTNVNSHQINLLIDYTVNLLFSSLNTITRYIKCFFFKKKKYLIFKLVHISLSAFFTKRLLRAQRLSQITSKRKSSCDLKFENGFYSPTMHISV